MILNFDFPTLLHPNCFVYSQIDCKYIAVKTENRYQEEPRENFSGAFQVSTIPRRFLIRRLFEGEHKGEMQRHLVRLDRTRTD